MSTKSITLEVYPNDATLNKSIIYKELNDIKYKLRSTLNRCSSLQFTELIRKLDDKTKDVEIYGKTFSAVLGNKLTEMVDTVQTGNLAQTVQFLTSKSNFNTSEILRGERTITTFKKNCPIIIKNKNYVLHQKSKSKYDVAVSLFNNKRKKELGVKDRINFSFVEVPAYAKPIIDRMIKGEYKQGSAQFKYNEKKKKWMFIMSYTFQQKENDELDTNKIMGIDLGITNVATFSIYDSSTKTYDYVKNSERMLDGKELIKYRQKIEARRKEMLVATKWCSENKKGHGRKQRTKDVDKISDKIARFRDTYNHKVSKYLVDMAIKYNCGKIQMENLSGFSEFQTESLLKNWSYYDLQSKIKYKAEENGIEFTLINPQYTSKRCSVCGEIHHENRDCKSNQAKFKCSNPLCNHEENADINASKNIAIPYIDVIIEDYVKENKLVSNTSKKPKIA